MLYTQAKTLYVYYVGILFQTDPHIIILSIKVVLIFVRGKLHVFRGGLRTCTIELVFNTELIEILYITAVYTVYTQVYE